jgi:hypothetical protein
MKIGSITILFFLSLVIAPGFSSRSPVQSDNIEFVCLKKQIAANQCHYNFIVDGGKFRYVDIDCRFKKKDEVIEKVKKGSLALAREWKIACDEVKDKKQESGY